MMMLGQEYSCVPSQHTEIARVLPEHGADPNSQDLSGRTPLHRASIEGRLGVASVLLEHGVDANARDVVERAPLHRAAEEGHLELALVLLRDGGADAWVKDGDGKTPLQLGGGARTSGGRAANAREGKGRTPLHVSSRAGTPVSKLCACCSRAGLRFMFANDEGRTAFQEALARGWEDVVQLLWEHGGREYPPR